MTTRVFRTKASKDQHWAIDMRDGFFLSIREMLKDCIHVKRILITETLGLPTVSWLTLLVATAPSRGKCELPPFVLIYPFQSSWAPVGSDQIPHRWVAYRDRAANVALTRICRAAKILPCC